MSRFFSCPEACRQAEPPPDIRKAVHIRSQIRRVVHIRKDIRSHIRRDFSARPHSQGFAAPDIRKAACIRRVASAFADVRAFSAHSADFLSRDDREHVRLNIRSQIKEKPRQSFAGDRGECLRPGYILCKHHKWCP